MFELILLLAEAHDEDALLASQVHNSASRVSDSTNLWGSSSGGSGSNLLSLQHHISLALHWAQVGL